LKNGAVTTKKIKNHAVTGAKLNLTGVTVPDAAHAGTADTATRASTAASAGTASSATHAGSADTATTAGNGVKAFVHLNGDGSVDSSLSNGITSGMVSHDPDSGIYCISKLGFTPKSVIATPDSVDGPTAVQASVRSSDFTFCPTGDQVELVTYDPTSISFEDMPTYVQLLG
jgi:hypothetical protein